MLDSRSGLIKSEFITLLKCDATEVVHGLVPHLGQVLELLARSKTIGTEQIVSVKVKKQSLIFNPERFLCAHN